MHSSCWVFSSYLTASRGFWRAGASSATQLLDGPRRIQSGLEEAGEYRSKQPQAAEPDAAVDEVRLVERPELRIATPQDQANGQEVVVLGQSVLNAAVEFRRPTLEAIGAHDTGARILLGHGHHLFQARRKYPIIAEYQLAVLA